SLSSRAQRGTGVGGGRRRAGVDRNYPRLPPHASRCEDRDPAVTLFESTAGAAQRAAACQIDVAGGQARIASSFVTIPARRLAAVATIIRSAKSR
ncbi:MAG: hypothetical protein ABI837_14905, partial [Acidobacteriota bacterium]